MLYLLSANSPKLLDVSLIAMGVLAIIVCLLSFVAFALFCVLAVKKDTSGNKGTKHQAIFPIFVLTLSPLIPIGVSAVLLIELALLVWAVVWLAKELKKPSAPVFAKEIKQQPKPEADSVPDPQPEPEIVFREHKASEEEEAIVSELVREDISIEEAHDAITDEVAKHFVDVEEIVNQKEIDWKKGIINIDTLSENFENGDTVTAAILVEKKLLPKGTNYYKVLARGHLNKHLTVEANEYSVDAIKMIILTGGKVVRIK